jgi:hypothetical protein
MSDSYVRCIREGNIDVTKGNTYQVITDSELEGFVRIVDDSGEDYLHPAEDFEAISKEG